MRRSPPASTRLPALAERKRPRAELTPDASTEDDRDRGVPLRCDPPFGPSPSPEALRVAAALLVAPWHPDAAVRAPPRLESLES